MIQLIIICDASSPTTTNKNRSFCGMDEDTLLIRTSDAELPPLSPKAA